MINFYAILLVQTRGLQLITVKGHFLGRCRLLTERAAAVLFFTRFSYKSCVGPPGKSRRLRM